MIDIIGFDDKGEGKENLTIEDFQNNRMKWYWVDFNQPSEEEIALLHDTFHFHPLAVEDCIHFLQRPKVDFYDHYYFFVYHTLHQNRETTIEINVFLGENYIVSFHAEKDIFEIQEVKREILSAPLTWEKVNVYISYQILDKIVDQFFPIVHGIEDQLDEFNLTMKGLSKKDIEKLFAIRSDLLRLRRTITSMRDLVYRIINSTHLKSILGNEMYYVDVYDHLLKLTDMVEANRDMTSDIRDSYLSFNSNRMNSVMTLLTVITAVFIPLTLISGIYGMNFDYMPELRWPFGYFLILGIMLFIAVGMLLWFKKKGWFDFYK
ncbi:MAG: magnesium/cobalt transporter CorA [Eubacteriales bacterium]